jgi:hypothetical protein
MTSIIGIAVIPYVGASVVERISKNMIGHRIMSLQSG